MIKKNKLAVIQSQFQGEYKKVLCVCAGGVIRSPTAALVLSMEPYNCNTRAAGLESFALIPVTEELLEWADEVVVMDSEMVKEIRKRGFEKDIMNLNIPDAFDYRDPVLVKKIRSSYKFSWTNKGA